MKPEDELADYQAALLAALDASGPDGEAALDRLLRDPACTPFHAHVRRFEARALAIGGVLVRQWAKKNEDETTAGRPRRRS